MEYICNWLGVTAILLCGIPPTSASIGNNLRRFQVCLSDCEWSCDDKGYPRDLPSYLTLFYWDCQDECKYICMHRVTAEDVAHDRRIKQFYGKVGK
jgi:hypothetical protein